MICQKCNDVFKTWVVIDNKQKNLGNRKFCLKCSPYGLHNTRDITKPKSADNLDDKLCKRCNIKHSITNFYKRPDGRPYAYCKPCANKQTIERQQELKKQIVEHLGGSCIICGYNKYYGALDLHHLDPSKKDKILSKRKTISFSTIKPEVDKCVLLCANCHAEFHGHLVRLPENKTRPVGFEPTIPF